LGQAHVHPLEGVNGAAALFEKIVNLFVSNWSVEKEAHFWVNFKKLFFKFL